MAGGRETFELILEGAANWANEHGKDPKVIKLPVGMAYDLAKCGKDDLGELSGKVFKNGVKEFEKQGLLGLKVKIIRKSGTLLEFE